MEPQLLAHNDLVNVKMMLEDMWVGLHEGALQSQWWTEEEVGEVLDKVHNTMVHLSKNNTYTMTPNPENVARYERYLEILTIVTEVFGTPPEGENE